VTDETTEVPLVLLAASVAPRTKATSYPEPFASRMAKREKRALGAPFGLTNFGVNLTRLSPDGESSILHAHTKQDEFIYILHGTPTLVTDRGETILSPGMCAGFPKNGLAHQLVNRTDEDVVYLEVGDRSADDQGIYPADDLQATLEAGQWVYSRKDGRRY